MEIWIWTSIIVVTLVLEFVTSELIGIWFSGAALVSLILSICNVPTWINVVAFCVLSLGLLIGLRKVCLKLLNNSNDKTNVTDSFIGQKAKLLSPIKREEMGTIKINGIVWNAISKDNSEIEKDTEIEILEIKGNKLVVKKGE